MSGESTEKFQKLGKREQDLWKMRHSAEHVLTQAVLALFPGVKMAMGPATDDGFYFDFEFISSTKNSGDAISEKDFSKIETEMNKIAAANLPIKKQEISVQEARELFKGNEYKQEWLDEIEKKGEKATVYWTGEKFVDLCAGPHVDSTGKIGFFKLLSIAGAYWRGDEKNKMLVRIYGTSFETQKELDEYLLHLEDAKKRDHRKLGRDLGLFTFSDMVGKGLPLFTEYGATIWREIERYVVDEEIAHGYKHVRTPSIAKTDLYRTSGHYPYYKEIMYPAMKVDEEELILRPMTCPHHFALYQSRPRSYRELPLRFAELASLYRYEKSGELTGLLRVREFVLADSHNFVRKEQAKAEIGFVLDLIEKVAGVFGFKTGENFVYRLSLGDRKNKKKYYDSPKEWDGAEELLREVLNKRNAQFYEAQGEAAFYGPKIDVQMKNVLGKEDTAFTVQYDFCLPKRFNLTYVNEKGEEEQPVVIHRSSVGAMERTIGFLIEHYSGNFPLWLAPVQIKILPITDKQLNYAQAIGVEFSKLGLRVEVDTRSETLQSKIRDAQLMKIPYMIIVGSQEEETGAISVRSRDGKTQNKIKLVEFSKQILQKNIVKSLEL
ncbi:threonine--tRNA ligase [Candidatus Woesebacteria bacterium RIFOXYB1_FULL_38_16]|uniref:Threonine--tRNA ligase n=1 Tax=Candidatus Woesebacteria bacterium RIFOXYB1_FULL_38_16 TaxID=1802538 RepID=A0A1F8CTD7_9BACT|nr:MAG: threonine--tRNA ligase [Candidatus Woesebacteria bacterium RIFOXYB1_FULL_38_16]